MMSFGDDVDGMGDRNECLQQLVDCDELDEIEAGIIKRVIVKGEESLTGGQKFVFKRVLDQYVTEECPRHLYRIPWGEMYDFHDSGKCCWCERHDERISRE
jgi:hypothetical protein